MLKRFHFLLFLLVFVSVCQRVHAQEAGVIAIAPFTGYAREDIIPYLKDIEDKLERDLKAAGLAVLGPAQTSRSVDVKKGFETQYMRDSAEKLGASYILWGSVTKIGQSFSLDAWLLKRENKSRPVTLSVAVSDGDLAKLSRKLADKIELIILKRKRIAEVSVTGNRKIESEAIKARIETKAGDSLNSIKLAEDIRAVYGMGYFTDVKVDVKESPKGQILTFILKEKPVVKDVKITGNINVETDKIKEVINIKPNTILQTKELQNAESKIMALYKEKGYYDVQVTESLTELPNDEASITFQIKEGEKVQTKEIKFVGNRVFSSKELKKIMETSEKGFLSWITSSGLLNMDTLERDISKLTSHYYNHGYIDAKVGEPVINHEGKWIYITIPIEEGSQYGVGSIDIKGDLIKPKEQLLASLKINKEKVYSREVLRKDVLVLTDVYANEGYAYAEVTPDISKSETEKKVNIVFVVQPGQKLYFDRIEIGGNTKTRDKVIRRELRIVEGEQFSAERLRKSTQRLEKLGFFEDVNVTPVRGGDESKMNLKIDVKERPTGAFSIGGGYSSVDRFIGMAEISQRNLLGRGQDLTLRAQTSARSTRYNLSFTEPYLFDTKWAAGIDLFNWEREYDDYTKKSKGGGLRLAYPLSDEMRLYGGYRYEYADLTDVRPDISPIIRESLDIHLTSAVSAAIERDTRNSYVDPTSGSINSLSVEYAGGALGGDSAYTKLHLKSGWFFPVFWDTVVHVNGGIGYVVENTGGKLPVYEKFYLGGLNSVRGFKFGDISPVDPVTGDRIGGEEMLLLNLEYIFPIIKKAGLKGVLFFDAGNAFTKSEGYDVGDLRKSVGFGFRWFSPLGPLRLEWGYNLSPRPGEEHSGWDFTIGGTF